MHRAPCRARRGSRGRRTGKPRPPRGQARGRRDVTTRRGAAVREEGRAGTLTRGGGATRARRARRRGSQRTRGASSPKTSPRATAVKCARARIGRDVATRRRRASPKRTRREVAPSWRAPSTWHAKEILGRDPLDRSFSVCCYQSPEEISSTEGLDRSEGISRSRTCDFTESSGVERREQTIDSFAGRIFDARVHFFAAAIVRRADR